MANVIGICEICKCTCNTRFGNHTASCAKVFPHPTPVARCWTHDDGSVLAPVVASSPISGYWANYYQR